MATQGNYYDCAKDKKGTGLVECILKTGPLYGWYETDLNWSMDVATETFNLAYIQQKIQEGVFTPFLHTFGFEDTPAENVLETSSSSGEEILVREGLPKFKWMFKSGYAMNKIAHSHTGYKNKGVILVWKNGTHGFSVNGDTIRGLRRGQLYSDTFKNNTGAEGSAINMYFQLINAKEYNQNMYLVDGSTLDFDPVYDVKGYVDCNVEFTEAPVNAATTCTISVLAEMNNAIFIKALTDGEIKISGKTITSAIPDVDEKHYNTTVDSAFVTGETHTPKLNDGSYDIVLVGESLYKGVGKATTVIA